jgi:AcrR family transcriptional regulator
MGERSRPVKVTRKYDASGRKAKAQAQHDQIVAIAEQSFLQQGYAGTTVKTIADAAGVSVDTIYKTFGGKPGLVRAIRDGALLGRGPVPAERRSDQLHDQHLDGRSIIRAWGALTTEVAPRIAPILLLVRDASLHDPELGSLLQEMDTQRLQRMAVNAARLATAGHLRSGLDVSAAADILWVYSSPELYELLAIRQSWTLDHYARFITDAMINALL